MCSAVTGPGSDRFHRRRQVLLNVLFVVALVGDLVAWIGAGIGYALCDPGCAGPPGLGQKLTFLILGVALTTAGLAVRRRPPARAGPFSR